MSSFKDGPTHPDKSTYEYVSTHIHLSDSLLNDIVRHLTIHFYDTLLEEWTRRLCDDQIAEDFVTKCIYKCSVKILSGQVAWYAIDKSIDLYTSSKRQIVSDLHYLRRSYYSGAAKQRRDQNRELTENAEELWHWDKELREDDLIPIPSGLPALVVDVLETCDLSTPVGQCLRFLAHHTDVQIYILHNWHGLSLKEIAQLLRLGVRESGVSTRKGRGFEKLAECVKARTSGADS